MHGTPRGVARLLRALIACVVLLFAVEAPAAAPAAWAPRDVSSWVAPRRAPVAAPAERRLAGARAVLPVPSALPETASEQRPPSAAVARSDGRYLYLELQSLL